MLCEYLEVDDLSLVVGSMLPGGERAVAFCLYLWLYLDTGNGGCMNG